jgi:hypothetical protein
MPFVEAPPRARRSGGRRRAAFAAVGSALAAGAACASLDGLTGGGADGGSGGGPLPPHSDAASCPGCDATAEEGAASGSEGGLDATSSTPIAFVQVASIKPTAAVTTLAFPATIAAEDAIVLCLNYPIAANAGVSSITDTLGNTYTRLVGPQTSGGAVHYVYAALNSLHGNDTITLTLSAPATTGSDLFILEYSGVAIANAFDVSSVGTGSGTTMSSGTATTTSAHELVIGYAEASAAGAGAGFTSRATLSGNLVEDKIVFSAGPYEATATTTAGAWMMIMATFKGR